MNRSAAERILDADVIAPERLPSYAGRVCETYIKRKMFAYEDRTASLLRLMSRCQMTTSRSNYRMSNPQRINPYLNIDQDGGLVTIDHSHHQMHRGNYYNAGYTWTALADNGTAQLFIVAPANAYVHIVWRATVGGDSLGFLYEGTTVTGGSGTGISAWSTNRYRNAGVAGTKVFHGPEGVNVTGTGLIYSSYIPAGAGPRSIGGEMRQGSEWQLSAGNTYLMRMVNHGGGTKTAMLDLEWYEDTDL